VVVVDLAAIDVREAIGCSEHVARRVLRLIAHRRQALPDAWRRIHG
jgi:hypothetical protein